MGKPIAYDEDVYLWSVEQAAALRQAAASGTNLPVDWENVAEEIESVGRSELSSVESWLVRVIEHLLKLEYSPASDPRRGWRSSVREHRSRTIRELKASPSLRGKIDLADVYFDGRDAAADGLAYDGLSADVLPDVCPWTLEQLLDRAFLPTNRHGLE
ncbi:MAG TPA: DUF29 domain-containing protein [Azospirillaceae bacterium]|nr:DUF29 domain-containing protein [Azospirillaceae bacterium]HRQ80871.1 DUF29 domain-containing protein [Azospirillaceae bacterium]